MLEVDGSGNQTGRNIYGTNLLMRQADGLNLYYMYNGHADVTALIDASTGNIRASYYYDAFGNILEQKYYTASGQETTTPINNSIMYAGYQYDEETGLYYLNARMYDPKVARFLQEDTYTGNISDPLSLNLYTYCHNEPIMYWDPTGHYEYAYIPGIGLASEYYKKQTESIVQLEKLFDMYRSQIVGILEAEMQSRYPYSQINGQIFANTLLGDTQFKIKNCQTNMLYIQYLMLQNAELMQNEDVYEELLLQTYFGYLMDGLQLSQYRQKLLSNPRSERILKEARKEELIKAGKQSIIGSSWIKDEDITELGTLGELCVGFITSSLGIDAPKDIGDLTGDIVNWKSTPGHVIQTGLDGLAVLPLIGAYKPIVNYFGNIATLSKSADNFDDFRTLTRNGDSFLEGTSITINTATYGWSFGNKLPVTSLNKRQRVLLESLNKPGSTIIVRKKSVSMNDLRQLTNVTGDEFSMFTNKGERLIIRGNGNTIDVSKEMYRDLIAGKYGKFSGHTHPGYSLNPGPADEDFLKSLQWVNGKGERQMRSSIWGNTGEGWDAFGTEPWLTQKVRELIRSEKFAKFYGNQ